MHHREMRRLRPTWLSIAILALVAALFGGCTADALYTYCDTDAQCGERTYYDEYDDPYDVPLLCVEVETMNGAVRTRGAQCTLECNSDSDCDTDDGADRGYCIRWAGEASFYCYQRCQVQEDCYPSALCGDVDIAGERLRMCLPNRVR